MTATEHDAIDAAQSKTTVEMPPEFTAHHCENVAGLVQYRIDRALEQAGSRKAVIDKGGINMSIGHFESVVHALNKAAEEIRALSRHGRAVVPAESAGAARDMREAAAKVADARFLMKQRLYLDAGALGDRGIMQTHLAASREAHDIAAAIRALPLPTALPEGWDKVMRSADEIRAELARCNSEAMRSINYNANNRKALTLANDARIAALEWVLSPSKPQEPNDAGN